MLRNVKDLNNVYVNSDLTIQERNIQKIIKEIAEGEKRELEIISRPPININNNAPKYQNFTPADKNFKHSSSIDNNKIDFNNRIQQKFETSNDCDKNVIGNKSPGIKDSKKILILADSNGKNMSATLSGVLSPLLCYECDSEVHGTSCLDPLDTDMVQLVDCKKSSLNTSVAADFECVQSEIIYQASNRQSYLRKCHPRTENLSYCQSLDELGPILGYKLRKCQVTGIISESPATHVAVPSGEGKQRAHLYQPNVALLPHPSGPV
ncbi:hypothetical protein FQA39_LY03706 [Lamprigera yunnana]|nr:hypothetical protein FQA39_LY03706 [Lamprigera yunnana]